MKRLRFRLLSVLLCIGLLSALLPVTALAAQTLTVKLPAAWFDAGDFHEGLAAVSDGSKWGYINTDGTLVIPCRYDIAGSFSEGLAAVATVTEGTYAETPDVEHWVFIDEGGNEVSVIGDNNSYYYGKRLYVAALSDGTYVANPGGSDMSQMGTIRPDTILPVREFYNGSAFSGGYAIVNAGATGSFTLPDELKGLADVLPASAMSDILVDLAGNVFWSSDWGQLLAVDGGVVTVNSRKTEKWGFSDIYGNYIVEPSIDDVLYTYSGGVYSVFHDGYASVVVGGKGAVYSSSGALVAAVTGDSIGVYSEGLFAVRRGGKWGYVDINGKQAVACQYDDARPYSCGVAAVKSSEGWYYIDKLGTRLNPVAYDEAESFSEGLGRFEIDGKLGFVSLSGDTPDTAYDVPNASWFAADITSAKSAGLVPSAFRCRYQAGITRGEMAELCVRLLENLRGCSLDALVEGETGKSLGTWVGEYGFTDCSDEYVVAASALGIVNGRGNGRFDTLGRITRQEAAKMLTVTAKLAGVTASGSAIAFSDAASVASWAKDYVDFVSASGIMNGTGNNNFSPLGSYTREQAIVTVYRLFLKAAAQG